MKKLIIPVLMTLLISFCGFAQMAFVELEAEPKMSAVAKMVFEEDVFDFGEIEKGTPVHHEFSIYNSGDAPLLISSVKTSCGCTASDYTKEAIAPGTSGFVKATYNASKEGSFNKSLKVVSNAGEANLFVKGVVK